MFFLLNLSCALAISLRIKATAQKPCFYDDDKTKLWLLKDVTQLEWGKTNGFFGRWGWITVTFHSFNENNRLLNVLYDQYVDGQGNVEEEYEIDCDDLHIGKKLEDFMKDHEINEDNRFELLGLLYPSLWGKITGIAKHVSEKATAAVQAAAEASRAAAASATEKAKTAATYIYRAGSSSAIVLKAMTVASLQQATNFILPTMKAMIGKLTQVLKDVVSTRLTAFADKIKKQVHAQLEQLNQRETWKKVMEGKSIDLDTK